MNRWATLTASLRDDRPAEFAARGGVPRPPARAWFSLTPAWPRYAWPCHAHRAGNTVIAGGGTSGYATHILTDSYAGLS